MLACRNVVMRRNVRSSYSERAAVGWFGSIKRFLCQGWRFERDAIRLLIWAWRPRSRVDPVEFDPEAFPIHCLNCGYALVGQEQGRCPECGQTYERGQLLVRIYARHQRPRRSLSRRCLWPAILVIIGCILAGEQMARAHTGHWGYQGRLFADSEIGSILSLFMMLLSIAAVVVLYWSWHKRLMADWVKRSPEFFRWLREHRPWEQSG